MYAAIIERMILNVFELNMIACFSNNTIFDVSAQQS